MLELYHSEPGANSMKLMLCLQEKGIPFTSRHEELRALGPWLAGTHYSLADANTCSMTAAIPRLYPEIFNEDNCPHTVKWLRKMHERPAVKAALAIARMACPAAPATRSAKPPEGGLHAGTVPLRA